MKSLIAAVFLLLMGSLAVAGQGTDVSSAVRVVAPNIVATISPRVAGDPRTTEHFYRIKVLQGDLYLNVVHRNFKGDVDVFSGDGRRPLSKMTILESAEQREIGRVIFVRSPGELIVRVEGRALGEALGEYRLKLGGSSFPRSTGEETAEFPVKAHQEPKAESISGEIVRPPKVVGQVRAAEPMGSSAPKSSSPVGAPTRPRANVPEPSTAQANTEEARPRVIERRSLNLKIEFEDGSRIEQPMNRISKATVEKDLLVITYVNGTQARYPITSVTRFLID